MCLFPTTLSPIFSFGRNMAYDRKLAFCRDQAFGRNLTFGHILAFGSNLTFGHILAFGSLAFGRIVAFGRNSTFGRNSNTSLVGLLALFTCRLIGLLDLLLQQKQYHGDSSKQQHLEVPRCNQVLLKLLTLHFITFLPRHHFTFICS